MFAKQDCVVGNSLKMSAVKLVVYYLLDFVEEETRVSMPRAGYG